MIRFFKPEDAERVKEIHRLAVLSSNHYTPAQKNAWAYDVPAEIWAKRLQKEITLVAEQSEITGFCSLTRKGELERLYVDPEYQGLGIGRLLLEAIEDEARKLCIVNITLNASLNAEQFYIINGYEPIRRKTHTIQSVPFEVTEMTKCATPW